MALGFSAALLMMVLATSNKSGHPSEDDEGREGWVRGWGTHNSLVLSAQTTELMRCARARVCVCVCVCVCVSLTNIIYDHGMLTHCSGAHCEVPTVATSCG